MASRTELSRAPNRKLAAGDLSADTDAELAIVRRQDRLDRPYYRLYAVTGGRQHFLLERGLSELNALAVLIGARTGWRQRDSV